MTLSAIEPNHCQNPVGDASYLLIDTGFYPHFYPSRIYISDQPNLLGNYNETLSLGKAGPWIQKIWRPQSGDNQLAYDKRPLLGYTWNFFGLTNTSPGSDAAKYLNCQFYAQRVVGKSRNMRDIILLLYPMQHLVVKTQGSCFQLPSALECSGRELFIDRWIYVVNLRTHVFFSLSMVGRGQYE